MIDTRLISTAIGTGVLATLLSVPTAAQQNQGQTLGSTTGTAKPIVRGGPAPRLPDGKINLGSPQGQYGFWAPTGIVQLAVNPRSVNRANPNGHLPNAIKIEDVPFQPWARALHTYRQVNTESDEPHTRCKPSGGSRQFVTPYGVEFVQMADQNRVYIFDIGGPHTYRIIHLDGRPHPKDLEPTYYGHNIGRWEGDTLIVDRVGFNEGFWIDREGIPHTDKLHMVERFTRTDFNTLKYEVTIDDPGAYTAPWTGGFLLQWTAGELFEYVCQDNNLSPEGMVGTGISVDRSSVIVP